MTAFPSAPIHGPQPPAAPRQPGERRWTPALAASTAMIGIALSGGIAAAALEDRAVPPVEVPGAVRLPLQQGWELAGRGTDDTTSVVLTDGTGTIVVSAPAGSGDVEATLDAAIAAEQEAAEGLLAFTEPRGETFVIGSATHDGLVVGFTGSVPSIAHPLEGEIIAVAPAGRPILFTAWAAFGRYAPVGPEVRATLLEAEYLP